mmetsp:Transcript_27429/g.75425  ORF Transcript_27429/g.75425 Transcript_27429/m.75425 type:complete len:390 (-) Transcript_27429:213-1382(-)
MKCYYKDPGWAECKLACSPGVNLAEPIQLRRPWSCEVAIMGVDPTWPPPRTEATTSRVPATTAPVAKPTPQSCTGLYGNCRLTQCCRDPSSKCYKRDDHWSECRQDCPGDKQWACSGAPPAPSAVITTSLETVASQEAATTIAAVQQEGTEVAPGPRPSLLCIALMLSSGMEVSLIKTQLQKGVGVFGCNGWNVYSNASVELSPGPPVRLTAEVIPGSLQCAFGHQFKIPNALNSEIFYRVWRQVIHDGHYLLYEWTVKLDPDAVVLPSRLRSHVSNRNPTDALYLNNCDEGLHGPIEVISHGGMKILANGLETCRNQLQSEWATYGEDVFMRHCFANLGVARQDDFTLLRERACRPYTWPMPCTTGAAAFHPLKTPKEYFECLQQAQR